MNRCLFLKIDFPQFGCFNSYLIDDFKELKSQEVKGNPFEDSRNVDLYHSMELKYIFVKRWPSVR